MLTLDLKLSSKTKTRIKREKAPLRRLPSMVFCNMSSNLTCYLINYHGIFPRKQCQNVMIPKLAFLLDFIVCGLNAEIIEILVMCGMRSLFCVSNL